MPVQLCNLLRLLSDSCNLPSQLWRINCSLNTRGLPLTQRFKNDYTKAVPFPTLNTPLSSCKIKGWSCIWWCHSKFPTALSLLQRPNPGKSFIFLSTSNTHTHTHTAASINWDTTTCRVNERSRSKEIKTAVSLLKGLSSNQFSSNPQPVIKTEWCTAEGNDALSHKAVFLMSVCDLFRVIGSLQWRVEVLGRSWSSGGAAGRWEASDWTDACLVLFEAEKHASKHVCGESWVWKRRTEALSRFSLF